MIRTNAFNITPQQPERLFHPVNNALMQYRQGMDRKTARDDQQAQQSVQNALAKQSMAMRENEFAANQAHRKQSMDMRRQEFSASQQMRNEKLRSMRVQKAAGLAQMARGNPELWQRFSQADPTLFSHLPEELRNDPIAGADYIIGEARGYVEPKASDASVKEVNGRLVRVTPEGQATEIYSSPQAQATGNFKDYKQQFDAEKDVRKEFTALNKDFRGVRDAYARVKVSASQDTGAGDVALIFNYMKMLDPGSVVREGEFATAEQTAGVPTQILNLYNKAIEGKRLTASQRGQFVDIANQLYAAQEAQYKKRLEQFRGMTESYGLDPSRSLVDFTAANDQSQVINEARDAIARGAPRDKVLGRLQSMGIEPGDL